MNGPHDLGGQHGMGPIAPERNEPIFHAEWEKRALGITLSCGAFGAWTLDESRHARESLAPATYLSASYYEIWTRALETLLKRHGFVTQAELDAGHMSTRGGNRNGCHSGHGGRRARQGRAMRPAGRSAAALCRRRQCAYEELQSGEPHAPAALRPRPDRHGEAVQGSFVFPDDNAHGKGENPQWLYTVVFDAGEIWGEGADPTLTVSIDAWESYLEHA